MSTTPLLFTATSQPYCTNAGKKHFCWEAQKEPSPCLADIDLSNPLPLPTGVVSQLASAVSICPLFSRESLRGWLATLWHGASSQESRSQTCGSQQERAWAPLTGQEILVPSPMWARSPLRASGPTWRRFVLSCCKAKASLSRCLSHGPTSQCITCI